MGISFTPSVSYHSFRESNKNGETATVKYGMDGRINKYPKVSNTNKENKRF